MITSKLLPGIKINNAVIEYDDGFVIRFDNGDDSNYEIEDFKPGACSSLQSQFADILIFLSAWTDSVEYCERNNEPYNEDCELFPVHNVKLKEWAIESKDDISMIACDLEEEEDLLTVE